MRLVIFWEAYYAITRRYSDSLYGTNMYSLVGIVDDVCKYIAAKNKLSKVAGLSERTSTHVDGFLQSLDLQHIVQHFAIW